LADTLAVRRQCFGDALFVMRYREGGAGVGGSLATPVPHKDTYVGAVMGFKEVEAALTERQHPISDGHLKRFEKGAAIPNREDALAVAAIFGFPDEASFYQAAHDLRVAHPHFPERPISGVSAQAAQFGRRAQTLRNVLGMTQEDIHQLEPDLSLGTISSIEKGERKTAVSPQIMDGFQHALGTPTPDSFEGRASDGKHVLEVRRANFNAALKLLREVLDVNQDELGRRAKAEYERMEAELGIPLPPNRFESGQMGPWANNVVPAHPVVIAALVRAAGAQNEADFYQKAGMGADEVRPEVFQRVGEYVEGYYAAAKTAALTGTGPQNLSIFTGGDDVETWRARLAQSSQGQVKGSCPDKY
jgi:transcriptional regulator with XRE-family HTH domain